MTFLDLRDSFEALRLDIKTLESVGRKLLTHPNRELDELRDQLFDIQINSKEYIDLYFERLRPGHMTFRKFKVILNLSVKRNNKKLEESMQLSDKKEKFASPLGREKSGDGRNPSPTFGRRTSHQEEMVNES